MYPSPNSPSAVSGQMHPLCQGRWHNYSEPVSDRLQSPCQPEQQKQIHTSLHHLYNRFSTVRIGVTQILSYEELWFSLRYTSLYIHPWKTIHEQKYK